MSDRGAQKRKSKGWYKKQAFINKRQRTDGKPSHRLAPGLKGFIVTCNDRERDAVKESYNILNEYADKLYGPEKKQEEDEQGGDEDIEKAIAKQVQDLKDAGTKVERRFQNCLTGAKNCIFIKTTLDDPAGLAYAIFSDLLKTKLQKCRYALRFLPVVGTCKANVKEINELAKQVLVPFFTEKKLEVTYTIVFKARNNNGLGREGIISTLRDTINETFPSVLLRYTLAHADITILVEVMCGVACIAVARDFAHFRKYNLVEVVSEKQAVSKDEAQTTDSIAEAAPPDNDSENAAKESVTNPADPEPGLVEDNTGSCSTGKEEPGTQDAMESKAEETVQNVSDEPNKTETVSENVLKSEEQASAVQSSDATAGVTESTDCQIEQAQ